MSDRLVLACVGLLGLLASGCQDACEEARVPLGIDEPGPAGESALDTFGFTQGTRVGTLTWDDDVYDVQVSTTLASTANVIEREHSGPGRLACIDSIEVVATVQIETTSALLLEDTFTIVLATSQADTFTTSVESQTEISDHEFEHLGFIPASAPKDLGLDLRLVWLNDAEGSMLGTITIGDDTLMRFDVAGE